MNITYLGVLILILERSKAGSVAMSDNLTIPADHEAERLNKCLYLSIEKALVPVKPLDQL